MVEVVLDARLKFESKDKARRYFQELTQLFKTWNSKEFDSNEFKQTEQSLRGKIEEAKAESIEINA